MADQILINDTQANMPGTITYPLMYVANIPAIWSHFTSTGGSSSLKLDWYQDAARTKLIGTSSCDYNNNNFGNRTFRPIAPYLQVRIVPNTPGGTTATLLMTTVADVSAPVLSISYVNQIGFNFFSLAASSNQTFSTQCVHVGPAVWSAASDATSFNIELQLVNAAGGVSKIDAFNRYCKTDGARPIYLGGGTAQIVCQNFDASAKNFSGFLNYCTDVGA